MGFFKFLTDHSKKRDEKAKAKAKAKQHLQAHSAEYSQKFGRTAEDYAGKSERTKKYAPQIGKMASQGATTGLEVVTQQAGRQGAQHNQRNYGNDSRPGTSQGPGSAWVRQPRPPASRASHNGSGGLRAPQASGNNQLPTRPQAGDRIDAVRTAQGSWHTTQGPTKSLVMALEQSSDRAIGREWQKNPEMVEAWARRI